MELLSDPSLVAGGAGLIAKGAATAGRLSEIAALVRTPAGAATVRDWLKAADNAGNKLLQASDELTGIPGVARAVGASRPAQA